MEVECHSLGAREKRRDDWEEKMGYSRLLTPLRENVWQGCPEWKRGNSPQSEAPLGVKGEGRNAEH